MSKCEALRAAQLWMIHEGVHQPEIYRGLETSPAEGATPASLPPRYWAAFVLSGNWE